MNIDFTKFKKIVAPNRYDFISAFIVALITTSMNIACDGHGVIYNFFRAVYLKFSYWFNTTIPFFDALKDTIVIIVRCIDITITVVLFFVIIHLLINYVMQIVYQKLSNKRRKHLKAILWESVVPNILSINEYETELIMRLSLSTPESSELERLCVKLSVLHEKHLEVINTILEEGHFETIYNNRISSGYQKFLNEIDFPSVYIIINHEYKVLQNLINVLNMIKDPTPHLSVLKVMFQKMADKYRTVRYVLKTNIVSEYDYLKTISESE